MTQQLNKTNSTIRSLLSDSQSSKKSFRLLVKNRITHQTLDPQIEKNKTPNYLLTTPNEDESFQCVKDNLKKYIKTMKATTRITNNHNKINTNRSSCQLSQKHSSINSSRSKLSSTKQIGRSLRTSFVQKQKPSFIDVQNIQKPDIEQNRLQELRKTNHQNQKDKKAQDETKFPLIKSVTQPHEQNFYNNATNNLLIPETTERQKIRDLESKIQNLLFERLKMLSSTNSFSSIQDVKRRTAYKLIENEMDRILQQIRKIKETEEYNFQSNQTDISQKNNEINKNIELLEKKVKIIERLIAQKLFEADNLRNQYLQKMKKNRSAICERKSKSSTFYREANNNPTKFKPEPYLKSPIFQNDRTTNRASFKIPLKSYYVTPEKKYSYNSNKLDQPLPRSTYNCQYMIYGAIPKQLISMESGQHDHAIFSNSLSEENQKNILKGSTYRDDFVKKFDKQPINFKQLDCYKDKFKNLQVNYGKEKYEGKIVNSRSVMQFYQEDKNNISKNKLDTSLSVSLINDQKINETEAKTKMRASQAKYKVEELNRSIDQMKQTEAKDAMIEQQELRKNNLFHQRIKSEIKHKNVYDQKYRFKNELMRQRIRKMEDMSKKSSLANNLSIEC